MIITKIPKAYRWRKDLRRFLKMLADSHLTFSRESVPPEGEDEGGDYVTIPTKRGDILISFKKGELRNITIPPKQEKI